MSENDRIKLGCGEAGIVIAAVENSINALLATDGEPGEIRQVAQRLNIEVGWPQNVVDAYVELKLTETRDAS